MPHRVGQNLEFARHAAGGYGAQVAAAEPLRRRHEPDQRAFDPAQGKRADDRAHEGRADQHEPEHDLALARQRRQSLADGRGFFGLARRQVAHEPRQLGDLGSCADRQRLRFPRPADIEIGMRE